MHLRNRERCFCQKIPANRTKRPCKQILTFCVSKFLPLQIHSCAFFCRFSLYRPQTIRIICKMALLSNIRYSCFVTIILLSCFYRDFIEILSRPYRDLKNTLQLSFCYQNTLFACILIFLCFVCPLLHNRFCSLETTGNSRFSKAQLHFFLSVSRKSSIFVVEYGNCIYNHTACERLYPLRSGASSKRISC